jgi:hypothetical protein
LDFIIIGIRKGKGKKKYSKKILKFEYWLYLKIQKHQCVFSGVPGNISGLFMGGGLCWWLLFLPTVSHGTTVRRDPNKEYCDILARAGCGILARVL